MALDVLDGHFQAESKADLNASRDFFARFQVKEHEDLPVPVVHLRPKISL